jgi:hypothetical protein
VGELASSVSWPPFTAKVLTTCPRPPVTDSVDPSGERRASTAPSPLVKGVVPRRTREPSGLMAKLDRFADPVLTEKRYPPSWLISTQQGAVWPLA